MRAGDKPGRGKDESEDRHRATRRRRRLLPLNPRPARAGGGARGISNRFKRQPDHDVQRRPDQARRRASQIARSRKAESGHPTVLAKPAIKVMPVIGPRAARP